MRVLTVNAGSSSVKLRLLDVDDSVIDSGDLEVRRGELDPAEIQRAIAEFQEADAVGHRIVHGGERFADPVRINSELTRALRKLIDLAPLHQPKSLAALEAASEALPDLPAVACFDTAFHSRMPEPARTYPLPADWRRRHGLRRFGFHGLSHAYAARRAEEILDRDGGRLVTCHLGAGASLAAVRGGRSVDTTMGFTPLKGLAMATRSGSVDPGLLLWLLERRSLTVDEMTEALEHESGLLGLAGTPDMREVLDRARAGNEGALLAREVYLHRLRAGIAAMAAALGGMDGLVFTGGVGENSAEIRELALDGLEFLGLAMDDESNSGPAEDRLISTVQAEVAILVISSREDIQIAHETRTLLS